MSSRAILRRLRQTLRSRKLLLGVVQRRVLRNEKVVLGGRWKGNSFLKTWNGDPSFVTWAMKKNRRHDATGWVQRMAWWRIAVNKAESLQNDIIYLKNRILDIELKQSGQRRNAERQKKLFALAVQRRLKRTSSLAERQKVSTAQDRGGTMVASPQRRGKCTRA